MLRRAIPWFILLLLSGCSEEIEPGTRDGETEILSGLTVAAAEQTPLTAGKNLPGTIQRSSRTTLVARSDGRVSGFSVREGEAVTRGQTLLTLADNRADAQLDAARSQLEAARARQQMAEAQFQLASRTYDRYARLSEGEAVTPQELDRVSTDRESARTALERARAEVRGAGADLESARVARSHTVVTAPFSATVVRKEARNGATVLPGTPLVTLDRRDGWELLTQVPETLWSRLSIGDQVTVRVPALDLQLTGTASEKLPAADSANRSFPVKISLPDHDRLESGLFARLQLPGEEREILTVPAAALVERGQLTGVYGVEDGILHFQLVKTGRRLGDRVAILSGLEPGDRIVVGGVARARDGARLEE